MAPSKTKRCTFTLTVHMVLEMFSAACTEGVGDDKTVAAVIMFQSCKILYECYKPLCAVLASDKPLHALICKSNSTSWIVFHCLISTLNNPPPPTQSLALF